MALLMVATSAVVASPAMAQELSWCDWSPLVASDEAAASALARQCERAVEVESRRGFAQRLMAQPDGTLTLESYARPQWAFDETGHWVEADSRFVVTPSGRTATRAAVIDVEVSPGGDRPFVTASDRSGRSISLGWPQALPAPALDGSTATYQDVAPDVDLRVTAGVDWFSYSLVVHSRQAAARLHGVDIEVEITSTGLEVSQSPDGTVMARDPDGQVVFAAGRAFMWDSSSPPRDPGLVAAGVRGGDIPGAEPGRLAEVQVELAGATLRVVPDQAMLADPATVFPLLIDPSFSATRLAWVTVGNEDYEDDTWWTDGVWPRNAGLRMGFMGWTPPGSEGYGAWRSMARFDTEAIRGATINSVDVDLTVYHTGGCDGPFPLQLWQVETIEQSAVPTSWNSTSSGWMHGGALSTVQVPSANSTGEWCTPQPDRDITFTGTSLRNAVQDNAHAQQSSITLGLRVGNESDIMQWMRAYLESLALEVNYTPITAVPGGLTVDGVGCLAPVGSRVTGSAPMLAGVPKHSEGEVRARIEVREASGSENLHSWLSDPVASGEQVSWQVSSSLSDGDYRWRMRSEDPEGTVESDWSGWCEFTADSVLDAEPGPAATLIECPIPSGPFEAATESVALLLAQVCDEPVEVMSKRDFGVRVLAQPDGTLIAEQFTLPRWALDGDDEWVDVDHTFVEDNGTITTVAAVSQIEVSAGGQGPLLTATSPEGDSLSLVWRDAWPAPQIDGNTVTYEEVFDDVDLVVTAGVDGFSYVLVVHTPQAAASSEVARITVDIQTDGLTMVQDGGGVVALDGDDEVVFSSPAAYMWDSSEPEEPEAPQGGWLFEDGSGLPGDGGPGRYEEMPFDLDGTSLTVEPDEDLLTDPEAEFPIVIDPPFSGKRLHWANIHQQQPSRGWTDDARWPREHEMRVGRLGNWPGFPCGDACGLWRSVIRFDTRELRGRDIISAAVKTTQTHTSGCGSYGLQLWHVDSFTSGTSWNGMSSKWNSQLQSRTPASSNRSGGCSGTSPTGVTYNNSSVRNLVQSNANANGTSLSFGFRSSDENSINPYRRIAIGSVVLEVEYNRAAQVPTNLRTAGQSCATSGPGPWLTDPRPTLSGTPRDADGRVGAHLQIRRIGSSSTFYSWQSGRNLQHNRAVNHRIPSGDRLPSGEYRWRMRSLDNHAAAGASDWSQWCYFRVDVTSPTTPAIELLGDPPGPGEQVTLRLSSSDAHSGLARFSYGVDVEIPEHDVSSSGTAQITVTAPTGGGRTWVYVWSHDQAGNASNRAVFDFFTARFVEATPVGAWRLDGDGVDDSGHGHELMLGSGVAWSTAVGPPADRSLDFDGTGCVSTNGPVVRTDAEYTVTAWVRLDSATGDYNIVTQAGEVNASFYLKARDGNWRVSLARDDLRSTSWAAMNVSATVGQWTHLTMLVDPAGGNLALYVNGQFADDRTIPWATWHADGALHVGCAARISGRTWDHLDGAVHHVGVWQGLLTPAQIQDAYLGELPAGLTGDWRLRADGADVSAHARPVEVPGGANWVDDQYGRRFSAMELDGTAWAESDGQIVRTDRSFAVAAWTKLDDTSSSHVVAAQAGESRSGFYLRYQASSDRWEFAMASQDGQTVTWHAAASQAAPQVGQWYHLTGVFDAAAGELKLYVDGELAATVSGPSTPWHADGELLIGASGTKDGSRADHLVGVISDLKTWRGALTDEQVAEVHGGNPAVRWLSQWDLDGSGADAIGSQGLSLTGTPFVDYEWAAGRWCIPFTALGLPAGGSGYAATSGAVLTSDESFTVAAWVRIDSLTSDQTVLSQGGDVQTALSLEATSDGRWRFVMPQDDTASPAYAVAESDTGAVQTGVWTHLAGVFDLARGEVRLFVDGELVDVDDGVESPWHGDGPLYAGVAGLSGGSTSQRVHGAIDEVVAVSSTLHPDRLRELADAKPGFPCFL